MNILFLTPCLPYPNGVGWQQRSFRHLKSLAEIGTVDTVLLFPDKKNLTEHFEPATSLSRSLTVGPASRVLENEKQQYLNEKSAARRLLLLLTSMRPDTVRPIGSREAPAAAKALPHERYDLVFCFRMSSASWLRAVKPFAKVQYAGMVIDFDDIESRWFSQSFALERSMLSFAWRTKKKRDIWLLRAVENRLLRTRWPILCCSEADASVLRERVRSADIHVIPNSISVDAQLPEVRPHDGFVVLFVGALDNDPNRDGLHFFAREVWPHVRRELGDTAQLHVVGRNPLPDVTALDGHDGIRVIGSVPTVTPEYARADICIAPIRFGSGTRTKILEAFAQGRPVVSTTLGAEGIDATDGQEIMLADDAKGFADAILLLKRDEAARHRMAAAAHRFVLDRYAEEVVAPRLQSIVRRAARSST